MLQNLGDKKNLHGVNVVEVLDINIQDIKTSVGNRRYLVATYNETTPSK